MLNMIWVFTNKMGGGAGGKRLGPFVPIDVQMFKKGQLVIILIRYGAENRKQGGIRTLAQVKRRNNKWFSAWDSHMANI